MKGRTITADDVRRLKDDILTEVDLYETESDSAIAALNYIGGIMDFQSIIIRWIEEGDAET